MLCDSNRPLRGRRQPQFPYKVFFGCCLGVFLGLSVYLYIQAIPVQPDHLIEEGDFVTLPIVPVKQKEVEKWRETLGHGEINHVTVWDPYGLSLKFKVIFENGMVASGKFMEPFSWWPKNFRPVNFGTVDEDHKKVSRRDWAEYQGYNELAGYYVAQSLEFYGKKPPTIGRFISSKIFYANDDSILGFLHRMLPEYQIPVSLIAWTDNLQVRPPSPGYLYEMAHEAELQREHISKVLAISDVMVFDFLLDDHDRIEAHNWLKDASGTYIFWDSGLSFRHGAHGRMSKDRDIFCGRREWAEETKAKYGTCLHACMFRNVTISRINRLHSEERLGKRVRAAMKSDPLYPVFHYNTYLPQRSKYPKVTYRVSDFLDGLDVRMKMLKRYVAECVEEFGEEKVLL